MKVATHKPPGLLKPLCEGVVAECNCKLICLGWVAAVFLISTFSGEGEYMYVQQSGQSCLYEESQTLSSFSGDS